MKVVSAGLRRWWAWSTAKGKRRKLIGFGLPLVLLIVVVTALTPGAPNREHTLLTPTPEPSPTTAAGVVPQTATPEPAGATPPTAAPDPEGREAAVIVDVIDGDTVVLEGGRRLRYVGVDTPETVAPGEPVACFGPEASVRNAELVRGRTVLLEKDVNDTDRFDRLLRYVYLEDGRMVNEVLVAEGYAISKAYPPDTLYQDRLDAAQSQAKAKNLGLWAACESVPEARPTIVVTVGPSDGVSCPLGCEAPPPGCAIKGNISDERIYHVPGQRDYENTVIRPENGERWFCTEAEAVANGWREAQR